MNGDRSYKSEAGAVYIHTYAHTCQIHCCGFVQMAQAYDLEMDTCETDLKAL